MKHTTLCYIEKDGKYLMLHRVKKQHDVNHDKWIGIGGHIDVAAHNSCQKWRTTHVKAYLCI